MRIFFTLRFIPSVATQVGIVIWMVRVTRHITSMLGINSEIQSFSFMQNGISMPYETIAIMKLNVEYGLNLMGSFWNKVYHRESALTIMVVDCPR